MSESPPDSASVSTSFFLLDISIAVAADPGCPQFSTCLCTRPPFPPRSTNLFSSALSSAFRNFHQGAYGAMFSFRFLFEARFHQRIAHLGLLSHKWTLPSLMVRRVLIDSVEGRVRLSFFMIFICLKSHSSIDVHTSCTSMRLLAYTMWLNLSDSPSSQMIVATISEYVKNRLSLLHMS